MADKQVFVKLENVSFDAIAFAHNLAADNYTFQIDTHGYGIYGKTPENGGVLEIGFVEQNPIVCTGPLGDLVFEENGIFIIPPNCSCTVSAKDPDQLHRHTSAEFLVRCTTQVMDSCPVLEGKSVVLPTYIPPSAENAEIYALIRSIARSKTAQLSRSYFEECADFMLLIHKLSERAQQFSCDTDSASPGKRRHCMRAKAYISENISSRLTVGDVATAVGVSKNYLTNVFSSTEGIPLMEYINRSKLSYMMVLIRRYGYTLAQAGKHVGFTDVNYISRIFKRYYGMTVTEYKRGFEREENQ